ncbi:uncharacterized protein LOC126972758 [Leptidea sinapis]|uniref:uncharacterized protein LOC126972758 n=1 Tax=Leptidea sinapis TaxID=189913 RepID=UPI0021283253|nr:uncharacterized protein LOC126972758 [Leptidea sinapis]
MSYDMGQQKVTDEIFYERKVPSERNDDFTTDISEHKDLFETISEAHYLPELAGPHDEALLESLVEKGCEDNQILGQALDKLAHLVHSSGDYPDPENDNMYLGHAPVSDIIERLEQSLGSPSRSSMTAAQGLLHLHHIGDHLQQSEGPQIDTQDYISDEVFVSQGTTQCTLETETAGNEIQNGDAMKNMQYNDKGEKGLEDNISVSDVMFPDQVPDSNHTYETSHSHDQHPLPDQSEIALSNDGDDDMCINDTSKFEKSEAEAMTNDDKDISIEETEIALFEVKQEELGTNEDSSLPTDLSIQTVEDSPSPVTLPQDEVTTGLEDNASNKSDEQPKDLSVHKRLSTPMSSPRRLELPRAPSRESDAMQSPQPSGIPAIPSSPEIFTMPLTKSKQTLFLETLLSSPSPKMYTSEVTITKQQCEPLNLGKHRKSASPTVSSCSDEIKKVCKGFGEPHEKKIRRDSVDDLAKISKVFSKCNDDSVSKKLERQHSKANDGNAPLQQLNMLKSRSDFTLPDPLLIPKDRLEAILAAPCREIPALLIQRPELRLPATFAFPAILQDPDILVISLTQLEHILMERESKSLASPKLKDSKHSSSKSSSNVEKANTPQPDQMSQPKPIPSINALAGDIDAATSAALNQMLWLPYLSQLEAMAACSQNMDFIKALNSSGYNPANYADISQMFNPATRFMGSGGFPMMPSMEYDNRMQLAMWQEAMSHANASGTHRTKTATVAEQLKELSKSGDVQNPHVHSTKNQQSKVHSAARTSPIAQSYGSQRAAAHAHFLQGMYPGGSGGARPGMQLPGLQIPYFNQQMMGSQRSPRSQQKRPSSPYYPNNNYLQSVKQSEAGQQRSGSASSQESPRPRISVRSLQNLLEPSASGGGAGRRGSSVSLAGRRREEPEVGSTTPLGEPQLPAGLPPAAAPAAHPLPPHHPHHPHDPASFHLWHPLFGNQKSYNSPWSWTTVTATGD